MTTSDRSGVLEFLKQHVVGRAVAAEPIVTHSDEGQITSAYEDDMQFSNLVETVDGFAFDLTSLARGTRYVVGKGRELRAEGTLNAVRVIRYQMSERRSSGGLVGYAHFISSTNAKPDPFAGAVFLVRMWRRGEALEVEENMVGYVDFVTHDEGLRPMAVEGRYLYTAERGQLMVRYEQATFHVDPETLARTPSGDEFPVQVSCEVPVPTPLVAA